MKTVDVAWSTPRSTVVRAKPLIAVVVAVRDVESVLIRLELRLDSLAFCLIDEARCTTELLLLQKKIDHGLTVMQCRFSRSGSFAAEQKNAQFRARPSRG
jgi:hypothetical protein